MAGEGYSDSVLLTRSDLARLVSQAAQRIEASGSDTPRLDAAVLLRFALGLTEIDYYSLSEISVSAGQLPEFESLVGRRTAGEPVAYLTGHKEFMCLDFVVDERVLIPRGDTEVLVEQVIGFAEGRCVSGHKIKIADVGTGSGSIAVSLAHYMPSAFVYAIDISADALEVAGENARRNGVEERVSLLQGDLLESLPEPVDVIAANLPYTVYAELERSVTEYEPRLALDGGAAGLDVYRRLLSQAPGKLVYGGAVFLEIDPRQANEVSALASTALPKYAIQIVRDLAGRDRLIVAAPGS